MTRQTLAQYQATFRPQVEEQVYDAEVRQKTCTLTKHLIVGYGAESWRCGNRTLGRKNAAQVERTRAWLRHVVIARCHDTGQGEQAAYGLAQGLVEVYEIRGRLFVKRTEVIGIVFELGTVLIG